MTFVPKIRNPLSWFPLRHSWIAGNQFPLMTFTKSADNTNSNSSFFWIWLSLPKKKGPNPQIIEAQQGQTHRLTDTEEGERDKDQNEQAYKEEDTNIRLTNGWQEIRFGAHTLHWRVWNLLKWFGNNSSSIWTAKWSMYIVKGPSLFVEGHH